MNNFAITISAIDKATATVRKINDSMSKLTRPINQVGKATKALGKELGVEKMAKSIGKVAKNAKAAASEITKFGAPILAIVGGGSLLGIAALANEWAHLGAEVSRTSKTLGVSASELQSLRGAAQVAGVSFSELTGGLKAVGDTLEDALYGRNQTAVAVLNKLGIGIHKTATGAIDSTRALGDLADAISNIKSAQVQGVVARTFGVEALLPMLVKGRAGMEAYQRKVKELGGVMTDAQVERAKNFGIALSFLDVAGQGLKNTIGDALIPAFQPLIEGLTLWIAQNRELIGQKIGEWARDFARWLGSIDWKQLWQSVETSVKKIGDFVDSIGGWKVAAGIVAAVMAGPLLLSITGIVGGLGGLALKTIPLAINGLGLLNTAMGGAEGGAAALLGKLGLLATALGAGWWVGNKINEELDKHGISLGSKFYDFTHQDEARQLGLGGNSGNPTVTAAESKWGLPRGLLDAVWAQESGRGKNMLSKAGAQGHFQFMPATARQYGLQDPNDLSQSADAAGHMYSDLLKKYHGNLPAALAAYNWGAGNVDKNGLDNAPAETQNYTRSIMARMNAGDAPAASASAGPAQVNHAIEIKLSGLPAGTKATAQKADGTSVPVRVAAAMPTSVSP